jgi:hypothetical protein
MREQFSLTDYIEPTKDELTHLYIFLKSVKLVKDVVLFLENGFCISLIDRVISIEYSSMNEPFLNSSLKIRLNEDFNTITDLDNSVESITYTQEFSGEYSIISKFLYNLDEASLFWTLSRWDKIITEYQPEKNLRLNFYAKFLPLSLFKHEYCRN